MSGAGLVGRIVAARVEELIARERGARVMFAVIDLSPDVTSAVAAAVGALRPAHGRVQVGIHPDLAVPGLDPALVSSDVAVKFRNNKPEDVVATVFSVPISEMEMVIQSLGSVERINEAWLLEGKEFRRWAGMGLTNADPVTKDHFHAFLRGLLASEVRISIETLADFVSEIDRLMTGHEGLGLVNAVNRALPVLHLPRESLEHSAPDVLARTAEAQLRRAAEIVRVHFHLQGAKGEYRPSAELRDRVDEMVKDGGLDAEPAKALKALIADRSMFGGRWTESQAEAALVPWPKLRNFFEEPKAKVRPNLGRETEQFLKLKGGKELSPEELATLSDIRSEAAGSNDRREVFFLKWRDQLRGDSKLYKRWERLVFNAPVEAEDLLVGLVLLAAQALRQVDEEAATGDAKDRMLLVRLRNSQVQDFWTSQKNTNLCRFLRDRYRGLDKLLAPTVHLRFGHCWSDWETKVPNGTLNDKGSKAAEFDFEAFVVPAALVLDARNPSDTELKGLPKAQMTWKPAHRGFHVGFSDDLAALLPPTPALAHLLCSRVRQARHGKSGALQAVDLGQVETLIDARGNNRGILTDPDDASGHIETFWPASLQILVDQDIVRRDHAQNLREAFTDFHGLYDRALRAFSAGDGPGLAGNALIEQAEAYGRLLGKLQRLAPQERSVGDLWAPLLRIGTAPVEGERQALIVAPWHPLRLAEIGAKARQAASVIAMVVASPEQAAPGVEDFVNDRTRALSTPYYADVGVLPGTPRTFVAEVSRLGDYGLLEPPSIEGRDLLADEPARETVKAFGTIAKQYLDLRPHEAANFSAVILDAESEDLPVLMASHLARQIEGEADLRCDLTVTHADPVKLRAIYERQNRRIGHEIDSSLTSEAAKTFLSRLRVGIASPANFEGGGDMVRQSDIVLLQNVIARHATVSWALVPPPSTEVGFADHRPCDLSRRRPYNKGNVRAGVYLTAPVQPVACRAYLDAVHDVLQGRAYPVGMHHLPMQEVDFASEAVQAHLRKAHSLGNWVMTYDRLADRRLISATDNLRVLRYFSLPRAVHNVIVSAEISRESFRERLRGDIARILPGSADEALDALIDCVRRRSASLSGGIVMRGAQWDNYAKELIGVVVAQRQIELLFDAAGPHRTAWFFLDEFRSWLDLSGEIADILAVDLVDGPDGPRIRLAVMEVKCVGGFGLAETQARSLRQLEATYAAMDSRFFDGKATVDPGIWRNRLADMLLEHIDPFDRVGDVEFEDWIGGLRLGRYPIELAGHSVVLVHDAPAIADPGPTVPDEAKDRGGRRRLAQWTFGEDVIRRSLSEIDADQARSYLSEPTLWPGRTAVSASTDVLALPLAADPGSTVSEPIRPDPARPETGHVEPSVDPAGPAPAKPQPMDAVPDGWLPEVHAAIRAMLRTLGDGGEEAWLKDEVAKLKRSLQAEGFDANVLDARLTPNSGLVQLDGRCVSVKWLEKNQEELATRHRLDIIRITPMVGRIALAIRRPRRATLHLSEAWLRRRLGPDAPRSSLYPMIGEREEDGSLFYLPLVGKFGDQERAAPHSIVSGATGSGKGILASSLILDICAFNAPEIVDLHLIDPKRGVDYAWVKRLPHMKRGIVDTKEETLELLRELVDEMEGRYVRLREAECSNIDQYNRVVRAGGPMPRVIVFFDEVANWMQDDEFKNEAEPLLNEIATKSRASGIHLTMIYQRADNQVMTMQLRTNLGNKLVLRLSDEGSSKIVLNEKGAEKLLGKGHVIAVLDGGDKVFGQVPYLDEDEVVQLAHAIEAGWRAWRPGRVKEAAE